MKNEQGEIIIYQTEGGQSLLEVHLGKETVWLTQAQMVELFQRDQSVISRHIRNVFKEGELDEESNMQKMHIANSDKPAAFYNLDIIISVGYRVKSQRGTQFRIWATSILKDHLLKGYSLNQKRLAEKGLADMEQAVALLSRTLQRNELVTDEGKAVLEVVNRYARSWSLLLRYDEDQLELPKNRHSPKQSLDYGRTGKSIKALKDDLLARGEASGLFGQEREHHLQAILGNLDQTFDGRELYESVEEKAAHLLYFVIKDHPFSDGNKRIGAFLFLLFLNENNLLEQSGINDNGLVALALLIAESDPRQKELMIRLIMNLLAGDTT